MLKIQAFLWPLVQGCYIKACFLLVKTIIYSLRLERLMFSRHIMISAKINYKGHQPNSCYCEERIINPWSRHMSTLGAMLVCTCSQLETNPLHVVFLQSMRIIFTGVCKQQPRLVSCSGKHLITFSSLTCFTQKSILRMIFLNEL